MVAYRHNAYKFCTAITDYVIIECVINNMVTLDTSRCCLQLPRKTSNATQETFMRIYGLTRLLVLQVNSLHRGHCVSVQVLVPGITYLEVIYPRLFRRTILEMLEVNVCLCLSPAPDGRIGDVETDVASLLTWEINRNETSDNLSADRDRDRGKRC